MPGYIARAYLSVSHWQEEEDIVSDGILSQPVLMRLLLLLIVNQPASSLHQSNAVVEWLHVRKQEGVVLRGHVHVPWFKS